MSNASLIKLNKNHLQKVSLLLADSFDMNISGYPKEYKDCFTIEMVAVDKKYRGQKFMSKLVRFCLEEINTHNSICLLQTETEINSSKYQHLGFKLLKKSETIENKVYSYTLLYDSNNPNTCFNNNLTMS